LRSAAGWAALALLGLVVAAAISLAASRLSSQHIGLSAEPLGAGQSLTPKEDGAAQPQSHRPSSKKHTATQTQTQPAPVLTQPASPVQPAPAPTAPHDDSGGDDSGGGGGHGGEDD
jgi:hypothetical protein